MSGLTADLMIKALDGLSARSAVTANNIANASSANFRPSRVTFEEALAAAATRGGSTVSAVRPKLETDAGDMRLDLELATASTTATRYTALIEVLGRQLQLLGLAASRNV